MPTWIADPNGVVRKVYEKLSLPDFGVVEPALKAYVDSLAGYKKKPAHRVGARSARRDRPEMAALV